MGYTHYFQQKKSVNESQWDHITEDAEKIINFAHNNHQISVESDDPNKKIITAQRINLNDKHNSHETFYLPKKDTDFNFCKTAQKPYDLVVCAILLVAHHHAPGAYDISSDGCSEDWAQASQLNARALGYAYLLPPALQDEHSAAIEAESLDLVKSHVPENMENKNNSLRFKF